MDVAEQFSEFLDQIVERWNANRNLMDGTPAPVERIINGAELVFATWPDPTRPNGVGVHVIKGQRLLGELFHSRRGLPNER